MASPQIVTIEFKDQGLVLYEYVNSAVLDSGDPGKTFPFLCRIDRAITRTLAYVSRWSHVSTSPNGMRIIAKKDSAQHPEPAVACAPSAAKPLVNFEVKLQGLERNQQWSIEASYFTAGNFIPVFQASGEAWEGPKITCSLISPLIANSNTIRPLPWGYRGELLYTISSNGNAQKGAIPFEFYVVSTHIHDCFRKNGLPIDLMRLDYLLPPWMARPASRSPGLVSWLKSIAYGK
jgi:hypothetical protein